MAKTSDDRVWHHLISKAAGDPFFLGATLAVFCKTRGLAEPALAGWLECSPSALDRLKLCRRPNDRDPAFTDEIRRIAAFAPCDPLRLVELYREVAALSTLHLESPAAESGFLLAARDRQPRKSEEPDD